MSHPVKLNEEGKILGYLFSCHGCALLVGWVRCKCGLKYLRKLLDAMVQRVPYDYVKKELELAPGGDLRIGSNQWIRSACTACDLKRVPRETQIRKVVEKVVRKKKLRHPLSSWSCKAHALMSTNILVAKTSTQVSEEVMKTCSLGL